MSIWQFTQVNRLLVRQVSSVHVCRLLVNNTRSIDGERLHLSLTFNVDLRTPECNLGKKDCQTTLKEGEGGDLKPQIRILRQNQLVLPTVLSLGAGLAHCMNIP